MIAISEDRVEPCQVHTVALDFCRTAPQVCANVCTPHRRKRRNWRPRDERRFGAAWQGGASVATLSSEQQRGVVLFRRSSAFLSRMLILLCWILDESFPTLRT